MRASLAFGIFMTAMNVRAGECSVIIYVEASVPIEGSMLMRAEMKTAAMFREIGVEVRWRAGSIPLILADKCGVPIGIRLESGARAQVSPNALAYATPFAKSGTLIHVLFDRTAQNRNMGFKIALLAHVLAHEIAHVLERIDRHSSFGVMKARWTVQDYRCMELHSLPFASEDVELIHLGIAQRMQGQFVPQ